jgi:hypothetical protein
MKAKRKRTIAAVTVLALAGLLWVLSLSIAGDLDPPATPAPIVKKPEPISVNMSFAGGRQNSLVSENGPDQLPERISQHEAWVDVFSEFNGVKDELMNQLEDAKYQFPELILAFRLVATYSNFLELRVRNLSRMGAQAKGIELSPVMDLDHRFRDWTFPPDLCPPYPDPTPGYRWGLTYQELRDMMMEEKLKRFGNPFEVLSCDDIREEYQETLERLEVLYQREFLTPSELEELYQCIEKLKELTDELVENGCITGFSFILDPNTPRLPDEHVRK